ncbi:solute carrier family 22 member 18 [Aliikangiella marina]|uniref:Solute carrier family 22 member 18 n=1 Tax=Aliikangiella marina TaxID=1712262 RepID=A0A545T2F1_9GAMM|nr:solute carrier family 22 member 18 [Aliikangiella marina]TQV71397.1 solute carrier family 22 member 18 [Aliikangiella marina]
MIPRHWKTKQAFLIVTTILMALTFSGWMAMLNNFVVEEAAFTGREIGILQSLREVPGFLAFTAVFILLVMKEQTLALVSLCLVSIGVAITGLFPFEYGLYATTVLMSIGFHYFETVNTSLTLQWVEKSETPTFMGKIISVKSMVSLVAYGMIWLFFSIFLLDFSTAYLVIGGLGFVLFLWLWLAFPQFESPVEQHRKLILRKRYWLYYLLTFFSGARHQIFMVFVFYSKISNYSKVWSIQNRLKYFINQLDNYTKPSSHSLQQVAFL